MSSTCSLVLGVKGGWQGSLEPGKGPTGQSQIGSPYAV